MSVSGVPLGIELELCVFPTKEVHPFVADRASVRWVRIHECGLVFGEVPAGRVTADRSALEITHRSRAIVEGYR